MSIKILTGDCRDVLKTLPDESVHCIVTSPPYYGLRDYGVAGQLGLEQTPDAYVTEMVAVFSECRRIMRKDGVFFLNVGDSYAGSWGNQGRKDERGTQRPINGPMMQNLEPYPQKESNTGRIPDGSGLKPKDLIGIPWLLAFALRADGWWLRAENIWHKPNPMPESVRDRTTRSHEHVFMFSKSRRYFYDADAIAEPAIGTTLHDLTGPGYAAPGQAPNRGNRKALRSDRESRHRSRINGGQSLQATPNGMRNKRSVWTIATEPNSLAHFAMMPTALAEICIKAGCPQGGTVLDPFGGAGTTGLVADRLHRSAILIELNPANTALTEARLRRDAGMFALMAAE